MIPFKILRTLHHFAVIQPPTKAKYIFFQGGLLLFLPICINVKWKIRKLLLSKARNKLWPNLILIIDQFRGIFFFSFFFKFSTFCLQLSLSLFVCVEVLRGPRQQLRSCRAGQLPINTVPGQA